MRISEQVYYTNNYKNLLLSLSSILNPQKILSDFVVKRTNVSERRQNVWQTDNVNHDTPYKFTQFFNGYFVPFVFCFVFQF
jgi:hypothetical protein